MTRRFNRVFSSWDGHRHCWLPSRCLLDPTLHPGPLLLPHFDHAGRVGLVGKHEVEVMGPLGRIVEWACHITMLLGLAVVLLKLYFSGEV